MSPPHIAAVASRALESVRTVLERATTTTILLMQDSPPSPSISSSASTWSSSSSSSAHSLPSIFHEVIRTYASEMSQSELLFFLSIAVAIVFFGIVLPVCEALSSTSSSNSSNKKKKSTWHKCNEEDAYELEYSLDDDDDEEDDIMETPCQLKIYVPGTGVIFLTGDGGGDGDGDGDGDG